jgi:hypothetical protein
LRDHAKHGDAWQRQHLSGITPVDPPDPEIVSGPPICAVMGGFQYCVLRYAKSS